jgi:hypothetical protein
MNRKPTFQDFYGTHWEWRLFDTSEYTSKDYIVDLQKKITNENFFLYKKYIKGSYRHKIKIEIYRPFIFKKFQSPIDRRGYITPEDNNFFIPWFPIEYRKTVYYYTDNSYSSIHKIIKI